MKNPWRTLASRRVYENAWLRVREDKVTRPDGSPGIYSVVEIRPSVGVVVLNAKREVALVGQWRYPHQKYSWEIPRGGSHEGDCDPQAAAVRELREETGVEAETWVPLGEVDVCNGVTTDTQHLFLATGIRLIETDPDPEEEIVTRWIPFDEALEMALSGAITECCTVAALLKVALLDGKQELAKGDGDQARVRGVRASPPALDGRGGFQDPG